MRQSEPRLIVVMGVSGSGKSTVAAQLAETLGATFLDADDYHPVENIEKMSRAEALTDDDRWPWLASFAEAMAAQEGVVVGACSALRQVYRQCINTAANETVLFVCLKGDRTIIWRRMKQREGHFMPENLLDSQLATLELPGSDELAISVDIKGSISQITAQVIQQLGEKNNE